MVVAVLFSRNAPAAASLRQSRAAAATSAPLSPTAAARGGGATADPGRPGPSGLHGAFAEGEATASAGDDESFVGVELAE